MTTIGFAIAVLLGAVPTEPPKPANDLTRMQGTWYFVELEMDGTKRGSAFGTQSLEINGNKFTTTAGAIVYEGTLELDPSQNPKTLNLNFTAGTKRPNPTKAIYEFDGANLKLCFSANGNDRPTAFATKPKDGFGLHTLSRNKEDAARIEMQMLAGEWSMVRGEYSGQEVAKTKLNAFKQIVKNDEFTVLGDGQVMFRAKFILNPTKTPKTIDYSMTEGPDKGKQQLGIYEFEGDKLTLCFAAPDEVRPTGFSAIAGSKREVYVWKHTKK